MDKNKVPDQLRKVLVDLLGEEKANQAIEKHHGNTVKLQWYYFHKKFKKQFGLDIRVAFITFVAIIALWAILQFLNG